MRRGGPGRRFLVASAVLLGALTAASGARAQAASPEPDEAAVLATLPFLEAVSPGAVFVDLAPEDAHRRLPLQLDTGASSSMLTPDLARELGVRVRRSKRTPYRRSTRLGRDLEFFVADRRGETGFGLLGGNFLAAYVVEVDWGARRVRLLDPARFEVPETTSAPDEAVLPARMVGNRPVVEIGVGGATIPVLLDTGASFGVLLGAEVAERLGIRGRTAPGLRAVGVKGPIDVEFVLLEEVALGALVFGRVPWVVAPEGWRQQATANDSLVGQDLLATCTLRVDYPRRRVWLRRREGAAPRFLGASWPSVQRSGALLYRRGEQIFVGVVLPDGPAACRGMRPGDVLADVDADAPGFDPEEAHARLAGDAPLRVRRAVGGGRSRTLVLEPPATSTDRP
ncbi:MAG: aspartyl protease family protein [Myxococcota bacterium]|nr:aspartyl protease family protein [Myxococcota bacterium]